MFNVNGFLIVKQSSARARRDTSESVTVEMINVESLIPDVEVAETVIDKKCFG